MNTLRSALVTGATGFLGSALVARLLTAGVEVTCLVRSQSMAKSSHPAFDSRVRVVEYGGSGFGSSLADVSTEVIFNLASYGVRETDRDPEQMVEGNVSLLLRLLRATAGWLPRLFVHTGSCSEYGDPQREGSLISENNPIRPRSLYGAAKAASVLCGNALASELNLPFVTLRLFGVYGTREAPHRLIPYLISRLMNDNPVDLTPGEQVRDLLFEDDAIAAFLAAATAEGLKPGEVYNVCTSRPTKVREVGECVADVLAKPRKLLRWGERPYRPNEPMWLVGDNSRFRQATNWSPTASLHDGICQMVEHARQLQDRGETVYGI